VPLPRSRPEKAGRKNSNRRPTQFNELIRIAKTSDIPAIKYKKTLDKNALHQGFTCCILMTAN
jgi:hypothetical protein